MNQNDLNISLAKTIEKNHLKQAETLLDEGAEANGMDDTGRTPLIVAAFCGSPEMVELLLKRGARIDAVDHYGLSVLHHSFRLDQPANAKCVQLLIGRGADVNAQDCDGQTPLRTALDVSWETSEDNTLSIHVLLDAGADIFIANHQGQTPHDVVRENSLTPWNCETVTARINAIHDGVRMGQDTDHPSSPSSPSSPSLRI